MMNGRQQKPKVMARDDMSGRSVKEILTDMHDIHDDQSNLTTQSHHISYLPLPALEPSLPLTTSNRCDPPGVPVPPPRRSVFPISRFSPVLG